jgi:aspartyl-tRNA(Asn)/glutamyl-tRNA(Gln) amidotransferase subunit A
MAREFNALGTRIILFEAWARNGAGLRRDPQLYGDAFRTRVMRGADVSRDDYLAALQAREEIERHYRTLFAGGIDAIVSPGREEPAMTMDRLLSDPLGVRGQYTRIYNLARIPALVMPMGFSPDGLPLGIQIAAASGDEAGVYGVAAALERAGGWTRFHADLESQARAAGTEPAHV